MPNTDRITETDTHPLDWAVPDETGADAWALHAASEHAVDTGDDTWLRAERGRRY